MGRAWSRRAVVAGLGAGISSILAGCAKVTPDLLGGTETTEQTDGSVSVDHITIENQTESTHAGVITILRDGAKVHSETIELQPFKMNDQNVPTQGTELLRGTYLDPAGDYRVEFEVGDKRRTDEVYREGATDSDCYEVVAKILPSGNEYVLSVQSYADENICER